MDPVVIYSSSSVYHPGDGDASCLATTVADTRTARLVAPRFLPRPWCWCEKKAPQFVEVVYMYIICMNNGFNGLIF